MKKSNESAPSSPSAEGKENTVRFSFEGASTARISKESAARSGRALKEKTLFSARYSPPERLNTVPAEVNTAPLAMYSALPSPVSAADTEKPPPFVPACR